MSVVREDLLHLSPEALSHMANAGIVKRALRELAAGGRPSVTVDAEGTLSAVFEDGVLCHWASGVTIQNARCSCSAKGVCRHRVMSALAYREATEAQRPIVAAAVSSASDEVIARVVPALLLSEAKSLLDAGISVDLLRRGCGEPCETARLPSATVRYWGGAALEAARCDCLRASACEHVALGVWAFRAAEQKGQGGAQLTVRLGTSRPRHAIDRDPFEQLVETIVRHGVEQGNAVAMQSLSSARMAAADAAWLSLLVCDLETWSGAYSRRSALYESADGVDLLAELSLRLAAGGLPGNANAVLGAGQGGETALDRARLMSLGARTRRDGEARQTTCVMVDPDTATRLVLLHDWRVPEGRLGDEGTLRDGEKLGRGLRLSALVQGQLIAHHATRRPDGSIWLPRARNSLSSVLSQPADLAALKSPVRFESVDALREDQRAHPVGALQPRHAARRFVVFSPALVQETLYDPQAQSITVVMRDAQGEPLVARRSHQGHAAHALDALAASTTGRHGRLRHVMGVLSWDQGMPVLEPWAMDCEHLFVVPDFAAASGALAAVALGVEPVGGKDGSASQLEALRRFMGTLLHHGVSRVPRGWLDEGSMLAGRLRDAGFRALSEALQALIPDMAAAQADPKEVLLGPRVMNLLALRQLHHDAAMLDDAGCRMAGR